VLRTPWIAASIALFSISGVVFGVRVAPLQKQLRALAQRGLESGTFDHAAYAALTRRWEMWGLAALITPLLALVLMVFKPAL
jgi:uncharacterized membrane protein